MAEREGFEPSVDFTYARFPGVCLKPLSHLSMISDPNLKQRTAYRNGFFGASASKGCISVSASPLRPITKISRGFKLFRHALRPSQAPAERHVYRGAVKKPLSLFRRRDKRT